MSEPVSAAKGAVFEGPDVSLKDLGAVGMITIRGDFASSAFAAAVKDATGFDLPAQRGLIEARGTALAWMSPDELLFVTDYDGAADAAAGLSDALAGEHALVANVSDARTMIRVSGPGSRELIAKGAPVDMSPDAFAEGEIRRSRLGQVAAAFWLSGDGAFRLVCFRSVGAYVFDWLSASARSGDRPRVL